MATPTIVLFVLQITIHLLAKLFCLGQLPVNIKELDLLELRKKKQSGRLLDQEDGYSNRRRGYGCCHLCPKSDNTEMSEREQAKICLTDDPNKGSSRMNNVAHVSLEGHITDVQRTLERLEDMFLEQSQKKKDNAMLAAEWQTVALILDRTFFYFYIILIGISLAVFFPRPDEP